MMRVHVEIICQERKALWRFRMNKRSLAGFTERMCLTLQEHGKNTGAVQLCLVNEQEIANLNRDFLHCNGPTNVLSFSAMDEMYANIFLASSFILREACLYGQKSDEYLLRMLAHGLCHIAGMDHGPDMEYLTELCLEAVYVS